MPTYSVDTAAVADTAARTRTRIATIQTEVDGMRGDIGLLQSCWTGTASDSMAACAADWHLTQIQVQSNLDQISLALDNAAVCYDDAEDRRARVQAERDKLTEKLRAKTQEAKELREARTGEIAPITEEIIDDGAGDL